MVIIFKKILMFYYVPFQVRFQNVNEMHGLIIPCPRMTDKAVTTIFL